MKVVRLGDVAERINIKVDQANTHLEYYVGGEHIESSELKLHHFAPIKNSTIGYQFQFGFRDGDILFMTKNPHLRKCTMANFEGLCSIATFVIHTMSDELLQDFLLFEMQSDRFWQYCEDHKSGGVNYFINWGTLANYEFTLPSLSEQKVLADKLWAAYRVKESYKKLLAATDDMLKAKFMEMFGGQGVVTLSEACDIVMGTSPDSQYYNTNCEGLPFYQGKTEFTDMYIGGAEVWCTKPIRVAEKNEILMSVRAPVGAINIAAEKCCIGRGLCSIKPKDNVTKLLFVFYALKLQEEEISRLGTGSTFKAVNKDQVYNKITLPLPPLPLQQQFVEIATQAEATKESLRKSIENIDQVIKSLINQ